MSANTVYLITGANRGIGRGMTASLLQRPSTTVVATVRDPSHETAASLRSLPTGENSKVVVLALDVKKGPATLVSDLASAGIDHLDIVIANAGGSSGYFPVLETDPQFLRDDFEVNVVGFMRLFQATWPLLSKSAIKKLAYISSSVGSIAALDEENMPGCTYGASKAAANWFAKKLSIDFKNEGLKVGIIHPGWVQTDMGQRLADAVGFPEPPTSVEDSTRKLLEQVDTLSEETSGKFLYGEKELPW